MDNLDTLSDEDLVGIARTAFEQGDEEGFRAAAGVLLARYKRMIASSVYRRLSERGAEQIFSDVVQEACLNILVQLRASRLKPSLRAYFPLVVNTACRDVVEKALRHQGYSVESRHAIPRVAKRPNAVPHEQRVSLNQAISADDDMYLEDLVADDANPCPEEVVLSRVERLEWMRLATPEQRLMLAIYGDYIDRHLKAEQIAVRRGLTVANVRRNYTEACRILQQSKEHRDE